jgi:hypothetical protein
MTEAGNFCPWKSPTTMKPPTASTALLTFFTVIIVPAEAQVQLPGTECNLVLNMTESVTDPGLVLKNELGVAVKPPQPVYENEWSREDASGNVIQENYEYATKTTSYKLSNRELLEILVDEGVITEITGWSLKAVFPAFRPDDGDSRPYVYIVRKPKDAPEQAIYIGEYFDFDRHASAKTSKYATVTAHRYDSQGGLISSSYNETGSISSKRLVKVEFETDDDEEDPERIDMDLRGIWNTSAQLRKFLAGELSEPAFLFVPGNGSFTAISGRLRYGNDDDDSNSSVIEGSWSFNGAKVLPDISILYPEAASDDD